MAYVVYVMHFLDVGLHVSYLALTDVIQSGLSCC